MRVAVFTRTTEIGPSTRPRFAQYRARFAREGVEIDLRPLFGRAWFRILRVRPRAVGTLLKFGYVPLRFAARLWQRLSIGRPDRVIVEHQLFPYLPAAIELPLLRGRRFVLEFDDAIWLTRGHRAKLERLAAAADRVIAGNARLAAFASRARGGDARVDVIETAVDVARFVPRPPRTQPPSPARPFVIAWIGLPANFPALESIAAPLARLAKRIPIVVRVISAGRPRLQDVPLECVEWSGEGEAAELSRCDAGVMPLVDDEWSRGKCGYKLLQYFAAGIPAVASPVGINAEIVSDGANGRLATSADEWHDRLLELALDPALAARLGAAGRRTAESRFDVEAIAPRIVAAWRAAGSWR